MANFFLDNKDLQYHLEHPLMRKIVELKERGFAEKDTYDYAPQNFEDAMDSYRRVLEIAGEVCGEVIAPNAEGVDHEGPRVENDHVVYAEGTARNIDAITKAGLSGMTLPYEYDGLNFPLVCFVVANEMVARGDAGFEKPAGEWNEAEIVCQGDRMAVYINGVLQNECSGTNRTGYIALQSEGGTLEFRNVYLTDVK